MENFIKDLVLEVCDNEENCNSDTIINLFSILVDILDKENFNKKELKEELMLYINKEKNIDIFKDKLNEK